MYLKKFLIFFFLFFSFFSLILKSQTCFSVSPLNVNLKISPGKTKKGTIIINNGNIRPLRIAIRLENWYLKRDGNLVILGADNSLHSCKDWIKLNFEEFELSPGETKFIKYVISVPKKVVSGDYWCAISFETIPYKDSNKPINRMLVKEKIMIGVYVRIGKTKSEVEITNLKISEKDEGIETIITIKNKGDFIFETSGKFEISDENGKKLIELELPEEKIFPNSERDLLLIIENKLPPGNYLLKCKLKIPSKKNIEFKENILLRGYHHSEEPKKK